VAEDDPLYCVVCDRRFRTDVAYVHAMQDSVPRCCFIAARLHMVFNCGFSV
jgi:hypothetical protein